MKPISDYSTSIFNKQLPIIAFRPFLFYCCQAHFDYCNQYKPSVFLSIHNYSRHHAVLHYLLDRHCPCRWQRFRGYGTAQLHRRKGQRPVWKRRDSMLCRRQGWRMRSVRTLCSVHSSQ
ncbi:hypothetical protein CaCOL14_004980 [Colletotrichum acutatum]